MTTTVRQKKWDSRFYGICMEVSEWSTCLSRKIGTVIVRDDILISTGFNGPPRGVTHCGEARVFRDKSLPFIPIQNRNECPRRAMGYRSGQGLEFCTASHAEENAIVNAARIGISTLGTKMYMNCGIPCRECLKKIINSGIVEIICMNLDDWYDELSKFLVKESDLIIRNYANERIE